MHAKVEEHLTLSKTNFKIRKHSDSEKRIKSPLDFAQFLDYDIGRITKTLFLKSGQLNFLCVVCPVLDKVNFKAIAKKLSLSRLQVASKPELTTLLNYPPMGVSPLGTPCPVLIEEKLLLHTTVLIGGGETGVEIEISPQSLVSITSSTTGAFCLPSH